MLCLRHDFYNIIFKIKNKLYIASGTAPPPPPGPNEKFLVLTCSTVQEFCKPGRLGFQPIVIISIPIIRPFVKWFRRISIRDNMAGELTSPTLSSLSLNDAEFFRLAQVLFSYSMLLDVPLCFNYLHFVSSCANTDVLHWKWIPIFVTASRTSRQYCVAQKVRIHCDVPWHMPCQGTR
jgi:hypothetical protein